MKLFLLLSILICFAPFIQADKIILKTNQSNSSASRTNPLDSVQFGNNHISFYYPKTLYKLQTIERSNSAVVGLSNLPKGKGRKERVSIIIFTAEKSPPAIWPLPDQKVRDILMSQDSNSLNDLAKRYNEIQVEANGDEDPKFYSKTSYKNIGNFTFLVCEYNSKISNSERNIHLTYVTYLSRERIESLSVTITAEEKNLVEQYEPIAISIIESIVIKK